MWQSRSSGFPYPTALCPGTPFPIKSLAFLAHVSPQTIHFWVLDKSPVSGPGRGPSSCNSLTCGVFFWPFLNSSGWWGLISSMSLTRTSCPKTTQANGHYGAWPGWAVPVSVLPLTLRDTGWGMGRAQRKAVLEASIYITNQLLIQERSDNLFGFSKAIQYPGVKYRAGSQRNLE